MRRLAGILLPGVLVFALFPACGLFRPSTVDNRVELAREVERLQGLYKGAVRVPMTPQIVSQVTQEEKDYLFGEISYFTSVGIALMHSRTGESSMAVEDQNLPKVKGTIPPAGNSKTTKKSSSAQEPDMSLTFQDVPVLTFREGGSSLDQRRITSNDEGHLKALSPGGDVFEIHYPEREITLGFALNREENWYDLEFAVDENTGERVSLAMTGVRPHLMINYQAVFPAGETRIQMDKTLPRAGSSGGNKSPVSGPPSSASLPEPYPPSASLPEPEPYPRSSPFEPAPSAPPAGMAEDYPFYPEDGGEIVNLGGQEDFYLEEAPPTPWGEEPGDNSYVGGAGPEVEVVFQGANAPASDITGPGNQYVIQVGAFKEKGNASAAFTALERAGFYPFYESHRDLTRVLIPAVEQGDLARIREKVKALGLGEPYVRQ
jgi:cell division septation protein DedD